MKAAIHAENETGWRIFDVDTEAQARHIASRDFNARYTIDPAEVAEIEDQQRAEDMANRDTPAKRATATGTRKGGPTAEPTGHCQCSITQMPSGRLAILRCPLCKAAPGMLAALVDLLAWQPSTEPYTAVRTRARIAILHATGKQ